MMKMLTNRAVKLGLISVVFSAQTLALASNTPPQTAPTPITTPNRSIFLNGIDISSARSQDLRNVHIKISETGDIFISAPQYQVTEEETFLPLSSYTTKQATPEHKPPQAMGSGTGTGTGAGSAAVAKAPTEGSAADKSAEKTEKLPTKSANPPSTPVINAAPGANSATSPSQPASAAAPKSGG